MTVRKITDIKSAYSVVPNKTATDTNLSWEARGMLLYLYSKPEDWEVCLSDLVNQTEGSRKHSRRDSCRAILKELEQNGYIQKTKQERTRGKFTGIDIQVCIVPFTDLPYTVEPSTVDPTQQSKEETKYRENKVNISDNVNHVDEYSISELCPESFEHCHAITSAMVELKEQGERLTVCKLRLEEWETCENLMIDVGMDDHYQFISDWLEMYGSGFKKKPSLPNIVVEEVNGVPWVQFYEIAMN